MLKTSEFNLHTSYNYNKCVTLTSSQEEKNHKLQLVLPELRKEDLNKLVAECHDLPRHVSIFSNLNLDFFIY